ncbi:MAG TPA: GH1 family beta-glucosidase [Rhodanobacteraceae bacterium]|nr:GH1 family beta-glucosidase [Rhodanobacteraceae bacterium]
MTQSFQFPDDFQWGCATAAYQIEGSPLADGAGPSIWQRFAHTPGMTHDGDTGDVACDHYRRMREDVRLMADLGLTSYRFSIAWGRVLPQGTGQVNAKGLDFYQRLVDTLLEHSIRPMVTLYHWDLPAALDDRGGWLNRDVADWFADYAEICYRALDDRVPLWVTLNEPWVVSDGGYLHGALAPGHRNLFEAPIASHNLLRAHGRAIQAYRAVGRQQIGLVVNIEPKYPASDSAADRDAVKRAHAYMNRQYLDPAFHGRYPDELREIFGAAWPEWPAADFEQIRQPIDFLGINYYTRSVTGHDDAQYPLKASSVRQAQATYTETGWEVFPQGLVDTLTWASETYGRPPIYITENGAAFYDPPVAASEPLPDPLRVNYLRAHLRAAHAAIEAGVDLRGYYAWSLLDNLEWSLGYSRRFGLLHVDYATQKRTRKASADFYARVIASHGSALTDAS